MGVADISECLKVFLTITDLFGGLFYLNISDLLHVPHCQLFVPYCHILPTGFYRTLIRVLVV